MPAPPGFKTTFFFSGRLLSEVEENFLVFSAIVLRTRLFFPGAVRAESQASPARRYRAISRPDRAHRGRSKSGYGSRLEDKNPGATWTSGRRKIPQARCPQGLRPCC